ncbi:DUF4381 domain-containing protein [Pseudomonas sp. PB103]|uniref:DUF4381 domain-containing protein n=1 Tax=Pseudomonas sp. PB103 TaxID=2494698 RepID=UPI00131B799D|nr:DUF4381 domain-containing protein [Pseudomonas sp. PB103]KAE9640729.1 DUF4381 domain-containing protein [Pseudomonas sp. PB103]
MNPNIPSIEQLKELGLPTPVSYAPQTWGWWVVLGVLILLTLTIAISRYRQWQRDQYRREALARLAQLRSRSDDLNALRELPELLKRVALSMPTPTSCRSCRRLRSFAPVFKKHNQEIAAFGSSHRVGALGREDWQGFLQQHSKRLLPADFSAQLAQLAYAPDETLRALPAPQRKALFDTCQHWVEHHHVAA